jgi:hypothetical protein
MTLQSNPGARGFFEFLSVPLSSRVRWLLLLFAALILASYWLPLWRISMFAPQYPKGLFLDIYSWKLSGGNEGRDLDEINILNHYIGMRRIVREELVDLNWLPFGFGVLVLIALRTALLGTIRTLIDLAVLTGYACGFAMFRFVWMLHSFGHELDEKAPMNIPPFTPAILGKKQVANFVTQSWPLPGSWLILAFAAGIWVVMAIALWEGRHHARARAASEAGRAARPREGGACVTLGVTHATAPPHSPASRP